MSANTVRLTLCLAKYWHMYECWLSIWYMTETGLKQVSRNGENRRGKLIAQNTIA